MAKANRKQIVWSDSMYNHNDHFLKFCILRSIGLTIQTVCRLDFLQLSTSEVLWWKHYYRQKRLLSFQNEQLFVFNDKQSTQYHKKHSSLINEMFWTRWLCEWRRRENRWQIGSACFFVLKRIWNWLIDANLFLHKWCLIHDFNLCDQWNTAYNRKRKQEHFWIILWTNVYNEY